MLTGWLIEVTKPTNDIGTWFLMEYVLTNEEVAVVNFESLSNKFPWESEETLRGYEGYCKLKLNQFAKYCKINAVSR